MAIGDRIGDWAEDKADAWADRLGGFLGSSIAAGLKGTLEGIDPVMADALKTAIEEIAGAEHSASIRDIVYGRGGGGGSTPASIGDIEWEGLPVGQIAIEKLSWLCALIGAPLGLLPLLPEVAHGGLFPIIRHQGARLYLPARLAPPDALRASWRDEQFTKLASSDLTDQGFSWQRIKAMREAYRPLLDPDAIRQLHLRGEDIEGKYTEDLKKAGYTPDAVEGLQELYNIVPPLADMVRFADFGALDPHIIELWRQFYDAPEWITKPMALLGITNQGDRDWANKYWFSHWRQPGRFELGEMHRRQLLGGKPAGDPRPETAAERAQADELVKNAYLTQGYSSFWQNKLLELVKQPLTRVDIRRMHKIGILDDQALANAYRDVGYYDQNNDYMVRFTKAYNATEDRDLTKTDIVKALKNGVINRIEALELLGEIDYSEAEAEFILDTEEYQEVERRRELTTSNVRQLYLAGIIDRTEVTARLAAIDYGAEEIARLLELWLLEAKPAIRKPTRAQLDGFLREDIITWPVWEAEMALQGYSAKYISWFRTALQKEMTEV